MIRLLEHTEIDKQKWDKTISASQMPLAYGSSWFLDAVCEKWNAVVVNDYESVMPLPTRTKLGIKYVFQPNFTQQLGVFSANNGLDLKLEKYLALVQSKYKFIDMNLNKCNKIGSKHYALSENLNYELSLTNEYGAMVKKYSSNTIRNLKKANTNDLVALTNQVAIHDLIALFEKDKKNLLEGLPTDYFTTLVKVFDAATSHNSGTLISVHNNAGKLIAAGYFITCFNRSIFLFSGNSIEGKKTGAMHFLIDSFIKRHCNKVDLLDFEGSNNPGLARFYQSFGATESIYLRVVSKVGIIPKLRNALK